MHPDSVRSHHSMTVEHHRGRGGGCWVRGHNLYLQIGRPNANVKWGFGLRETKHGFHIIGAVADDSPAKGQIQELDIVVASATSSTPWSAQTSSSSLSAARSPPSDPTSHLRIQKP